MNYLLDTNLVLIYLRDNLIGKRVEQDLGLLTGDHNLIISVVSIGELKSLAKQNKWGVRKIQLMENLLLDFLVADINNEQILERYSEIDTFSQGKLSKTPTTFSARNMGKNDLWIAATACVANATLLTTDKDFQHLNNIYLNLETIELSS